MEQDKSDTVFDFFTEVGIIAQLGRAILEARLPDGLLQPHFSVLNHLIRLGDGKTPLSIAEAFQVPKTSMSHTLAGLEKRKLIEMRPNPEDGRSKCVFLTEDGKTLMSEVIQSVVEAFAATKGMPVEAMTALTPDLAEIRKVLDAGRD